MAHLCKKLDHALNFLTNKRRDIFNESVAKILALSGGVASNRYLRKCIELTAEKYNFTTIVPTPDLCTGCVLYKTIGPECLSSYVLLYGA